ncbi:MAG: hypothetical protein ACKO6N_25980 [Myxococcota bacterium]
MKLDVAWTSPAPVLHARTHTGALTLLLALSLGLTQAGCGGSALSGSVNGLEMQVQDGFYAPITYEGNTYAYFVLTDLADACTLFSQEEDLGANYHVFIGTTSALEPGEYPLYSPEVSEEVTGDFASAFYNVRINSTNVLSDVAVAGSIQITNVDLNGKVLTGVIDAIFGGLDNGLQGSFQLAECAEFGE